MIQRSRFVLFFVLILLLIAVGATAFALLYDPEYVKQLALRQVEQALGRKIEVGRAHFEIFPRLRLELSQVVVREADGEQVFFSADRLDLVLRALPLLQQKVVGKYLTVEHPRVTLRRDHAGQWNFLPPIPSSEGQVADEGHALGLFLLVSETVLMNGEVTVIDEFRSDGVRSLHLGALDLVVMVDREGRRADLRLSSTLRNPQGASALILDGTLRQAQPSVQMASEDLSRISPAVLFEGEADAINLSLPQFVEFFGPRPAPPQLPQAATVRGHLTLRPGVAGYDMMLSEMSAKVEDLLLSGQASLSGLMTAQPTFSLTVGTPMLRIEDVLSRVPEEWVPSPLRSRLVESNLTGLVQVVSATVSGAVVPESRLSVNGEFRVTEVRAPEGDGHQPLREVAATIFLEPDRVRVADVTGYYGPLHVSGGRAIVSYLEPGPWLEMEVAGDMMAAELVGSLASSGQTGPGWDALQALREVQGGTLVTFRLVGPLNQTDELRFVEGEIVIQDGAFRTQVLPVPVAGLTGQIRFSDKGAEFERIRGQLGTSAFEVQGAIKAGQSAQFQDLIVRARGEAEDLMRILPPGTFNASTLQGVVGATVTFSGPMTNPRMKGALDLRTIGLAMPGVFEKPLGTRTFVEFDGALGGKSNLVMDRVDVVFPPFRLTGKGAVRFGKSLRFHASLVSGPIAISGLPQGVLLGKLKDGILEVTLDIKGRGGNWR
ncbi:MAG: AsmA family protein, partial [Nitrospirales bacterium]